MDFYFYLHWGAHIVIDCSIDDTSSVWLDIYVYLLCFIRIWESIYDTVLVVVEKCR